jgi:putative membrane protein
MKKLVIAAALLAFAAPAYAQTSAPTAASPSAPGTANQMNAQKGNVSAATKKFATTAAMTDMFEIQAGQLAQQKTGDSAYKDFAQMIVSDHTKTTNQLKDMTTTLQGLELPQQLDKTHQAKIDKLNSLSGAAFDRQFKTEQVQGHKQAIQQFQTYAKSGDNPELKSWAEQTLPALKTHLQHAEALATPGPAPTTGSGMRKH